MVFGFVLFEIVCVLCLGSVFGVFWLVCDDIVLWVKWFVVLLCIVDENVMSGDYGIELVYEFIFSKYFLEDEYIIKCLWVLVNCDFFVVMVVVWLVVWVFDFDVCFNVFMKVVVFVDDFVGISGLCLFY